MINYKNPKPHFEEKKPPLKNKRDMKVDKNVIKRMLELIDKGKEAREEYFRNAAIC